MKKKIAIYIRVSKFDQNPNLQKDEILAFCKHAEYEVFKIYIDLGFSGKDNTRPEFIKMMNDAKSRKFDMLVVWKFDRFARSTADLINSLETFNHLNIDFISIKDKIDTSSAMGKLMFTIVAAFAEFESNLIAMRVKSGMAAAKKRGVKLGRNKTSYTLKSKIEKLAFETDLSINQIREKIKDQASRAVVGKIVKEIRDKKNGR